jgi:hypothetical protein
VKSKLDTCINNTNNNNNNKNNNTFKFNSLFLGFNTTAIGTNCRTSTIKKGEGCNTDT